MRVAVETMLRYVLMKRGELAVAATYICTVLTFIVAYTHPSASVLVTINDFNEAKLEIVLILLSLPAAFRFLVTSLLREADSHPQVHLGSDARGMGDSTFTMRSRLAPIHTYSAIIEDMDQGPEALYEENNWVI